MRSGKLLFSFAEATSDDRVHDRADVGRERVQGARKCGTVAALPEGHDDGAELAGDRRGGVATSVVADDDVADERAINLPEERADRVFLVESWDHYCDRGDLFTRHVFSFWRVTVDGGRLTVHGGRWTSPRDARASTSLRCLFSL